MSWESQLDDELVLFVHILFLLHIHLGWIVMQKGGLWWLNIMLKFAKIREKKKKWIINFFTNSPYFICIFEWKERVWERLGTWFISAIFPHQSRIHTRLERWLGKTAKSLFIFLFSFFFFWTYYIRRSVRKYHITSVIVTWNKYHSIMSHDQVTWGCRKIVHRPCSSCISSIPEINENFIEFSLLTQTC